MALKGDPHNGLYLARPCQLTRGENRRGCRSVFWTSGRFHSSVIDSMDEAISTYVKAYRIPGIILVGYSGGGAVAALIAARRKDVTNLITVAGTLDHQAWTEHHKVSPLQNSLNAKDVAFKIKNIRQTHFIGAEDKVVPRVVSDSYLRQLGSDHKAKLIVVPGADHKCCWVDKWPELLNLVN